MALNYGDVVIDRYGRVLLRNDNGKLVEIVAEETAINCETSFGFSLDTCDNSYCDDNNCRGNDWGCGVSNCTGGNSYCHDDYC